jgi:hypothetical protein
MVYLTSSSMVATSNTVALAATVLGFDLVELWSHNSCTFVHASNNILQTYGVETGPYPNPRAHVLSPRLCDLARDSTNGYYWHVVSEGEEEINCFGKRAQTEVAFMLKGEDGQFDVFLVGFAIERIQFKVSKAKFLSGLCYAIYIAVYDMDDDDDEGDMNTDLDLKADIARERLSYISKFVRKSEVLKSKDWKAADSDSSDECLFDVSELQFEIDETVTTFYVPLHKLTSSNMVAPPSMEMMDFNNVLHLTDGSNSNLYTATKTSSGNRVVIKMIKKEVMRDDLALLEFDSEGGLLSRVSHPNIIKLLGVGTRPRRFLVLEYLGGGSLSSRQNVVISTHGLTAKPILRKPTYTYDALLTLIKTLAGGLNYLHTFSSSAMVIHRDIKPDNIGFDDAGNVKIFDFGLSSVVRKKKTSAEAFTMTGNTGSLRYMAPEVVLNKPYNEKVDVYSFGIMVWQLASDRVAFKGLSKEQFMRDVVLRGVRPKLDASWPSGFKTLLEGCWHHEFEKRPSFAFIVDDLNTLIRNHKWEQQQMANKMPNANADYII